MITSWHEDDYGLPGGIKGGEIEAYGRRGTTHPEDYASSKDRSIQLALSLSPRENKDAGVLDIDYSYRNRDTYAWFDYGSFGATATKRQIDTHGVMGKYTYNTVFAGRDAQILGGVDLYDSTNDILGSGAGLSASTDDLTISKKEIGLYVSGEYEILENVLFNAGTRYQKAFYTFDRRDTPFYETQNPHVNASLVGLKYEYSKGSNIYANAQETFRFLATDEWYNTFTGLDTRLIPQRGHQFEVGIKHNVHDVAVVNITPYFIENKNEIFLDPSVSPGNNRNYDKTQRFGIETGAQFDIKKALSIEQVKALDYFINYTYQIPKFSQGAFKGNDIPMAPRHGISSGLKTGLFQSWYWTVASNYRGEAYAINDTTNHLPHVKSVVTVDTKLSYEQTNWEVFLKVDNLFDRKYFSYVIAQTGGGTNSDYFPAQERTYQVGMTLKF